MEPVHLQRLAFPVTPGGRQDSGSENQTVKNGAARLFLFLLQRRILTCPRPLVCPVCLQWHALSREEQAKYYELARKERQLHMQLYPGWSARDNYVSF